MTPLQSETIAATIAWLKSEPANLISDNFARDECGNRVATDSQDAVCFCTLGYMMNYAGVSHPRLIIAEFDDRDEIVQLNDNGDIDDLVIKLEGMLQ